MTLGPLQLRRNTAATVAGWTLADGEPAWTTDTHVIMVGQGGVHYQVGGFANPMTTLGDIIYESATPAPARLAGNTTSTKNFLTQTGTGSASAAPVWGALAVGDLPTVTPAKGGTGLTTLTAHAVLLGEGTSNVAFATTGTAGQILIDQGSGNDPAFEAMSGDATLAASGALTLATVASAGTYGQVVVNVKGLVTSGATCTVPNGGTGLGTLTAHAVLLGEGTSNVAFATIGTAGRMLLDQGASADPAFTAMSGDATLASSGALTLSTVNSNVGTWNTLTVNGKGLVTAGSNTSYLTGNQTITLTGDTTGSGATSITTTLKNTGTAGTYTSVTTDAQGRVTAGTNPTVYLPWSPKGGNLVWTDATHIVVKAGQLCDSTSSVMMTLASNTTINTATLASLGGMDVAVGTGTATVSSGNTAVSGSGSNFLTVFGSRVVAGTVTNSGTAVTGSGFLAQIKPNDLIGNSTSGYARVTAVPSDTSLTLAVAPPNSNWSGATVNVIEQPTIKIGSNTVTFVQSIASNTALVTVDNASATASSAGYETGAVYAGASFNTFYHAFVVVQSGTTGVILSTQRTTPFMTLSSFRRVGGVMCDSAGNLLCFAQSGGGNDRYMQLLIQQGASSTVVLSAGGSSTWTTVACAGACPQTASQLRLAVLANSNGSQTSIRPANDGATHTLQGPETFYLASSIGYQMMETACDAAQNIQVYASGTNVTFIYMSRWLDVI